MEPVDVRLREEILKFDVNSYISGVKRKDLLFRFLGALAVFFVITFLFAVAIDLLIDGWSKITDPKFYTSFPSRKAERAGILSAWVGTIYVMGGAIFWSILLGIPAGIYLEEYGSKGKIARIIEANIANLAAVPSIVYGLLALGIFVYRLGFSESILTAGLTLGLLMLPVVVVATRESIRRIPRSIREAAYALGATRWETLFHHILPYSSGGILTGVIIAASRAVGETAPLITIGALTYIAFLPPAPWEDFIGMLKSPFTVLPIQMFNWVSRPQAEFHTNAAATGFVLLVVALIMNSVAFYLRYKIRRRYVW
ncbi:phosphate ABC transporter membrane protein 2 (PhoT family) [Hydrogenivirga caldilitoris]|uniref:Phosphate transport system permease protein PstA n=1 Tax=Hydrogenivirga caldilitoris TaxID=246264 RepID=A0A497XPY3_9AQUI|nr:phosphate ABC transporter permease PstA [Hydrogenivirga caldilitoris]RLJ70958.1 phosphate ABC transporter membrane protein 2 (PhoT family) [Hydrogenivirga caldilitoris]